MAEANKNFYNNLNRLLKENSQWPSEYLLKFIDNNSNEKYKYSIKNTHEHSR